MGDDLWGEKNINLEPYEILCATISNNVSIYLSYLVMDDCRATEWEGAYDLTQTKLN